MGLTSFRRYCWSQFPDRAEDQVTVLRPPVPAGEEAQIDYGLLGSWTDPAAGRVRRVWAFVMVLACCRHMFVRPVLRLDAAAWVAAHVAAFTLFESADAQAAAPPLKASRSTATRGGWSCSPTDSARCLRSSTVFGIAVRITSPWAPTRIACGVPRTSHAAKTSPSWSNNAERVHDTSAVSQF